MFNVPQSTLCDQRAGIPARHNYMPNLKKLTKLEEKVIVKYILDLNSRGFAPTLSTVKNIVDKLLTAHTVK